MSDKHETDYFIVAVLIVLLLAAIAAMLSGCNAIYGVGADLEQITKGYTVVEHQRPNP